MPRREKTEQLTDEAEIKIRYNMLEAIQEKITDYNIYLSEYEYAQYSKQLELKGIDFMAVRKKGRHKIILQFI